MAVRQSMLWLRRLIRGGVSLATAGGVVAVVAAPTAGQTADIELGRHLANECMTCHRAATANSTIPDIFELGETHIAESIKAYRAKSLPNPVMQSVASRLNDEEIAALAAYFATAKRPR